MGVVYVTGAPATGKSTLCKALTLSGSDIEMFCYSEQLRDHLCRHAGRELDESDIRQQSAKLVTAQLVEDVDRLLLKEATQARSSGKQLLIDSHPVTKEAYGFRVTPFKVDLLRALAIDTFVCLYADPGVLAQRIRGNAQGRPLPSKFELSMHVQLQAEVVAQYAVLSGRPCHLVDSSIAPDELAVRVRSLANLGN